jgi:queuine tRNA-ribosyltransferase
MIQFRETQPRYGYEQSLFPIVARKRLSRPRIQSAEFIASQGADGNADRGLQLENRPEQMYEMTELVCGILPKDKPRYLMGVGTPVNILEGMPGGLICLIA